MGKVTFKRGVFLIFQYLVLGVVVGLAGCSSSSVTKKAYPEGVSQGVDWQLVDAGQTESANRPSATEDAAVAFDTRENRMVLFGGKNNDNQVVAETWFYYPSKDHWEQLTASTQNPPGREDHVLIYDSYRHKIVLHGGEDGNTSNVLWELDLETLQWEDKTSDEVPFWEDHSAAYITARKSMIIFGGKSMERRGPNDLLELHLDPAAPDFYQWSVINPDTNFRVPDGRMYHSMGYDASRNNLLIYGGWDPAKREYKLDTWIFSFADSAWFKMRFKPRKGKFFPPPRRHAESVVDPRNDMWIIFGGKGVGGPMNDIWGFDLKTHRWINLTPGPLSRTDHAVFYDPSKGDIFIYGGDIGLKGETRKFHDLWKVNIQMPEKEAEE